MITKNVHLLLSHIVSLSEREGRRNAVLRWERWSRWNIFIPIVQMRHWGIIKVISLAQGQVWLRSPLTLPLWNTEEKKMPGHPPGKSSPKGMVAMWTPLHLYYLQQIETQFSHPGQLFPCSGHLGLENCTPRIPSFLLPFLRSLYKKTKKHIGVQIVLPSWGILKG